MNDWKPIETAPKDGTPIDIWDRDGRRTDVFWSASEEWWCTAGDYPDEPNPLPIIPAPTHWQPLPGPPRG